MPSPINPVVATVAPPPPTDDRADRMRRLFGVQAQPESPEPLPTLAEEDPVSDTGDDDEPAEGSETTTVGYDWNWTARKLVAGMDIGGSILIDRMTDRIALDAGEEETKELVRVTAEYGEKRLGKVEAPLWLVFLIAFAFFVVSKYSGAPKKEKVQKDEIKPIHTNTTTTDAGTADTSIPAAAPDAVTPETSPPMPTTFAAPDGNVGGAMVGY